MNVDLIDALSDRELFQPWFIGQSWSMWRAVLKAAYAKPLSADELALFHSVAGDRDPPEQPVHELWIAAGRRAGKDSIAGAIVAAAALADHSAILRPGERGVVLLLACDREQSKIVLGYVRAFFERIPMLRAMVVSVTATGLALNNSVDIVIATNSFRSVRGRTIVAAVFDEAAYWRDENSTSPDTETYRAITPGMVTVPNSLLVGISSPYRKAGLLYNKWKQHFGKPDPRVLYVQGPSRVFNPTIPQEEIDAAVAADPESAAAEWLGQFRGDISDFISRDAIEACVVRGLTVRPPLPNVSYYGFVDPSGGSNDAFTMAVCHREGQRIVLDAIGERRAPFAPDSVTDEFAAVFKQYRVSTIRGDNYAAEWPKERFRTRGIQYDVCDMHRSELYLAILPLINSGRVDLLDNQRMISQFVGLERRTARSGRDSVDHAPNSHDDISNSVAGAVVMASSTAMFVPNARMVDACRRMQPIRRGSLATRAFF
jgi:hypothetical protein